MNRLALLALYLSVLLATGCSEEPKARVVIVGIDGADWKIIEPLIDQHRLPAFERLQNEGASGPLHAP